MSVSSSDEEQYRLPALGPIPDDEEPKTIDEVKERLKEVAEELARRRYNDPDREDLEFYEDSLKDKLFALTPAMPYREWKKEEERLWALVFKTPKSKFPKEHYALKRQIDEHEKVKHYAVRSGDHVGRGSVSPPPELAEPSRLEVTLKQIAEEKAAPKKFVFNKPIRAPDFYVTPPERKFTEINDPFPYRTDEERATRSKAVRILKEFASSHPKTKKKADDFLAS